MHRKKLRFTHSGAQESSGSPPAAASPRPSEGEEAVLGVGELTRGIRRLLETAFGAVLVRGEITGFSAPRSGHVYFQLRDASAGGGGTEGAQLAVVLFREEAARLSLPLSDGLEVVVRGRLSVYAPRGAYQLIASQVRPAGVGALALLFEKLKAKLQGEGLFRQERKRPLPFIPSRIALITSPTGAAVEDVLRSIRLRHPEARVRIFPVRVQGTGAAAEIIHALDLCASPLAGVDVAILARGGGGPEDLAVFNDEGVVRAVARCAVPVISAIGHEIDFTLCDFAADVRAQTPTQAGELVVPEMAQLREGIVELKLRLVNSLRRYVSSLRDRLDRVAGQRILRRPQELIAARGQRLDDLSERLKKSLYNIYRQWQYDLNVLAQRLEALSPLQVLKRGYALVFDSSGRIIRRSVALLPGSRIRIQWADGTIHAKSMTSSDEG